MAKKKTTSEVPSEPKTTPDEASAPALRSPEYTVLARRYRPQQFADLVGQDAVAQSLLKAIASNRVAHAYLFTGARGVGKTSTARILAKALNCVQGPTATPCDVCDQCRAIASGEDIDVLEIDGASNRGINEVREIRQNIQFRPSRSRYKVYIIDEVHMLSREAFNALLKTLEEPPAHVKFIFATTEIQKIPITILSRCQRFDFPGIGLTGIVDRLKAIVASEQMEADPEALTIIARRAGGSMRDAQTLLDQLFAFGGATLTPQLVHRLLGTADEERVCSLAAAVLSHHAAKALDLLGQAVQQGLQLGEFLDQLLEYWRDLMVVQCAGMENQNLSVTGKHKDVLKEQAKQLSLDTIMAGMDVLVTTKNRMRFSSHGQVLLEMALVRLCRLEELVSLSQLASWVAGAGGNSGPPALPKNNATQTIAASAVAALPSLAEKKKGEPEPAVMASMVLAPETVDAVWQQVLSQVGVILAASLRKIENVAIFGPNTLVLRIPPAYNSTDEQYLDSNRLAKVEEVLTRIVGQPCSLRLEVGSDSSRETGTSVPQPLAPLSGVAKRQRQRSDIAQVPLVGKAMDVLGGQIVQMDDKFASGPNTSAVPEFGEATEEG